MKTRFLLLLLLMTNLVYGNDFQEQLPLGKAIYQAGSQRTLSQRLAKSYLAILTRTDMQTHLNQMEEDLKTFENNFIDIKKLSFVTPKILQEIKQVEQEWVVYKKLLAKAPVLSEAHLVLSQNNMVLAACNTVVESLEKKAQKVGLHFTYHNSYSSLAHLTNIAERQRMLSQQIMTYYLAYHLHIQPSNIPTALQKTTTLYNNTLHELMGALENTAEIDFKLICLLDTWKKVADACKNLGTVSKQDIEEMSSVTEFMFSEMETIANKYEALIDTDIASLMLNNALSKAGQQRMLCQKITKAYVALALDIEPHKHRAELDQSIHLFATSLADLKTYAPIPEIQEAVEQTEVLWQKYQLLVSNTSQIQANAKTLIEQNTPLLQSCHNIVLMLKIYSKMLHNQHSHSDNLVNLIDLAEQQNMLSQRMVLYCMASNWMPTKEEIALALHHTIEKYTKNIDVLLQNSNTTDEIRQRLQGIIISWTSIADLCSQGGTASKAQLLESSNQLLQEMSEVTALYEHIIDNLVDIKAVDKAGLQRMLSQRIALDALAISMNLDVHNRQEQLQKDIHLFSKQLHELKIYTSNHSAKNALNQVVVQWKNYKKRASGSLSEEDIHYLIEHNTELLNTCQEVVSKIMVEGAIESRVVPLLELAGNQRMLSQRIALYALAYRKGIQPDLCKKVLDESIVLFKTSLNKLERSSLNSPEVYALIDKQKGLLQRLEGYINNIEQVDLFQILVTNNILLADAEMLVQAYEQLHKAM